MTDNEKKRDEDLQRAAEEFFADKVSHGYTPGTSDPDASRAILPGSQSIAHCRRYTAPQMTGVTQGKQHWRAVRWRRSAGP
jgi:hypothetical protein